jgi:RNA polymerase-interacting CarD/CdnL/TRCF family regulator
MKKYNMKGGICVMFEVGEKVVYPAQGVGKIEAIKAHYLTFFESQSAFTHP